ncbi:MAG: hypothetical protein HC883_05540 [Bdellovibrionaceae bacterium]|nr:hypothetical protein [Pseudobdellovibrionaceae bacterium]
MFWIFFARMGAGEFAKGVAFDMSLGYGGSKIENPDQSEANYKTLALSGRLFIPFVEKKDFGVSLLLGLRYLDLENNANTGNQSEFANLIGPGLGLQIRAYKFFVGSEYHMMFARHHAVGSVSRSSKYEMPTINIFGGITIPFQQLSVSFSYSQSSGTVPKDSSGLSESSAFCDQIYWLHLTYSTGASPGKFLGFLF